MMRVRLYMILNKRMMGPPGLESGFVLVKGSIRDFLCIDKNGDPKAAAGSRHHNH
jgi:hypothetical protein